MRCAAHEGGEAQANEVPGLVGRDNKRVKQFGGNMNVVEVLLNNMGCQ